VAPATDVDRKKTQLLHVVASSCYELAVVPLEKTAASETWKGYAEIVTCTVIWAGFSVVAKLALVGARPEVLASWRFLVAGVLLLPWLWLRKSLPALPRGIAWFHLSVLALLGVFCHNLFMFFGLKLSTAFEGALISNTVIPIATPLIASLLKIEKFDRNRLPGLMFGTFGVVLIFAGTPFKLSLQSSHTVGLLLFFCAGVGWSTYTVLSRRAQRQWRARDISAWVTWIGAAMLLPFGLYDPIVNGMPVMTAGLYLKVGYMAILHTLVAFFMWQTGVQKIGPARSSVLVYLVPVFTLALSSVFLGERPTNIQMVGGLFAMGGVIWANRRVSNAV